MMKNVKHIVVTRLALKWRFNETNLSWDNWLNNSIFLMDNTCRLSLKNQSNQNFTLLSLVDESVNYFGSILDNEVILKVPQLNNGEYPKTKMIEVINDYVKTLNGFDSVIITRLDRDDALRYDYINNVQNYLSDKINEFVDLNNSISYDYLNDITYFSKKYYNTFVSPFVSVHEKINNNKINCISLLVDHNDVPKYLMGKKIDELYGMQIIHDNNLSNKLQGKKINVNLNEYGLKNNKNG